MKLSALNNAINMFSSIFPDAEVIITHNGVIKIMDSLLPNSKWIVSLFLRYEETSNSEVVMSTFIFYYPSTSESGSFHTPDYTLSKLLEFIKNVS